jgi:uncharacterized protein
MRSVIIVGIISRVAFAEPRFVEPSKPGCASVEGCEHACAKGRGAACRELAEWLQDGDGVAKDVTRAQRLFTTQCDAGDGRACNLLGVLLSEERHDDQHAAILFERACRAKDAYGCAQLGGALADGRGVALDVAHGTRLLSDACDGGVVAACFHAGTSVERDGNFAAAAHLYRRGCDGGRADACNNLGVLVEHGKGVTRDFAAAAKLYERGCDGGSDMACANFAGCLRLGRGIAVDKARANELYQRACKAGDAPSCQM